MTLGALSCSFVPTGPAIASALPIMTVEPGGASRRTSARAIGPRRGETAQLATVATTRSPRRTSSPGPTGAVQRNPCRCRLGLPR